MIGPDRASYCFSKKKGGSRPCGRPHDPQPAQSTEQSVGYHTFIIPVYFLILPGTNLHFEAIESTVLVPVLVKTSKSVVAASPTRWIPEG